VFENIRQRWNGSGKAARAAFFVGLLAIILIFAWMVFWAMRDNYQVLFSDLDPADAATMVSELERMKVAYRLEDGGKSIMVDKETVYKTRLKLMGKGVNLRGTVGFEIFNNTDFGTTEFAQKINYQRALQGELARTIMDFEEIKFARVHLVMPESGLFKKNNVKPKASISLIMKGDSQLSREQVTGIQRLVAASVPEIDPAAVTILDQRGVALTSAHEGDSELGGANGRLETKKQIETYLTRKVADMLDKAIGAGQAIVSIDATLTSDHVKITREDVIPLSTRDGESAGSVVRRRQSQQKAPAASSEAAAAKWAAESAGASEPTKKEPLRGQGSGTLEIEYQNGRKVEQIVSSPGSIKRISVGVLLPDAVPADRLDKIREVVSMAAGINAARGDSIAIYSIEQFAAKSRGAASAPEIVPGAAPGNSAQPADQPTSEVLSKLWMLFAAAFVLLLGALLFRGMNTKTSADPVSAQMSEAERLEALVHVSEWLRGGASATKAEART
jgi:flagellar M-ring protein FliF